MRERVMITGLGAISAFGVGVDRFTDGVVSGACGVTPVTAFDTCDCHSHLAAQIRDFDPAAFIPPLKLRRIDSAGRLALVCARLTIDDAGYGIGNTGHDAIGVALGTFTAGLDSTVEYLQGLTTHGPTGVPALLFSNTVSNAAASLCAIEFGLRGPNVTFNHREASSLMAVAFALGALRDRRADAILAGGIDRLEETFFRMHDRFRALSPMRGSVGPEAARPFDRRRNGFVLGEGGFLLLLETQASAAGRGARVYGELLGSAITSAPTRLNAWLDSPAPIARAMRLALEDAALDPAQVDVVFATANGSPRLDRLEAEAITTAFGGRAVPVVSLKGGHGECGASGAAAMIAALAALTRRIVPPTVGFAEADPAFAIAVSASSRPTAGTTALVNSVSAAGTQCSVVLRVISAA